jgi:putative transposase
VCNAVSPVHIRHTIEPTHFCPYCGVPLHLYKERSNFSIFKCYNNLCKLYLDNKKKLNFSERLLFSVKPFEFKLHYQFREYHFSPDQLVHSSPQSKAPITNIRNSLNTLCLVLTFHVSFAISARKTAYLLREVFKIKLTGQSVLNYCEMAAFHCHKFNFKHKGTVDKFQAGDETYIRVNGLHNYTFLFISTKSLKITAYHIDATRDTLPATIAIKEAVRTANLHNKLFLVTDGNPSYNHAVDFLNKHFDTRLKLKNVIGLQNLDAVSTRYRPFKQLIERLNRTYKFHMRAAAGFSSKNGAIALTTLFVTFYNFLRPHMSLDYNVPIPLDFLNGYDTLQARWAALLQNAIAL